MFFRFIVLLVSLSAVFAASNSLRKEAEAAIPVDVVRTAEALSARLQANELRLQAQHSAVPAVSNHPSTTSMSIKTAASTDTGMVIKRGYFFNVTQSNSDCSGILLRLSFYLF